MCGIAGFSLSKNSRVNARSLAHELLAAIESRGSHASGFAFVSDDDMGVYKDAKPGSRLPLYELPRTAKTVILHTRFATQGSPSNNANNHPVISPNGTVAVTHNGVISNDYSFRFGPDGYKGLAEVDSAVIPAIIEDIGIRGFSELEGYAALAWLDELSPIRETLHLARLEYSPVHYTWLPDGSFVYASTEVLLLKALNMAGLPHGGVFSLGEGDYLQIVNGFVMTRRDDLEMMEDRWARQRWSGATAGRATTTTYTKPAGSTTTTPPKATGSEDSTPKTVIGSGYVPSTFGAVQFSDGDDGLEDDAVWADIDDKDERILQSMECSMDDAPTDSGTALALLPESNDGDLQGYYLTAEDDSIEPFETIEALEARLEWYAGLTLWDNPPHPDAEQKIRWVNFIQDVGHISVRDGMVSWLEDLAEIDQHESPAVYNLDFIRDGLGLMLTAKTI